MISFNEILHDYGKLAPVVKFKISGFLNKSVIKKENKEALICMSARILNENGLDIQCSYTISQNPYSQSFFEMVFLIG